MRKTRLTGALAGFVALLFAFNTFADGHEEDEGAISDVWVFAIKRGMEDEFGAAMSEHIVARKEMGESRTWYAYRAEVGHHPGLVMYRSAPMSYADHDAYLETDFTEMSAAFNENIDPLVDHFHHYIDAYDRENSHWPEDASTEGPLFTEVVRKWRPGGGYASNKARKKMSQVALNDGWAEKGHEWLWIDRIGGEPAQAIVFPNANYAEMAPSGEEFGAWFTEQLGSEEAAAEVFENWLSGFSSVTVTIWRHDTSLSTPSDDQD